MMKSKYVGILALAIIGVIFISGCVGREGVPREQGIRVDLTNWWQEARPGDEIEWDPVGGALLIYWLDEEGNVCHGVPGISGQPKPIALEPSRWLEIMQIKQGSRRERPISLEELRAFQNDTYFNPFTYMRGTIRRALTEYDGHGPHLFQYVNYAVRFRAGLPGIVDVSPSNKRLALPVDGFLSPTRVSPDYIQPIATINRYGDCYKTDEPEYYLPIPETGLEEEETGQHPTKCRIKQNISAAALIEACSEGRLLGSFREGWFRINYKPNQPKNLRPPDGDVSIFVRPRLTASAFSDPDGHAHNASEWRIYTTHVIDIGGSKHIIAREVYRQISAPATEHVLRDVSLNVNTTYRWQVRYQDEHGAWSEWSELTSFRIVEIAQIPIPPPVVVLPTPVINFSPTGFDFSAIRDGANPPAQNLGIRNTGLGTLNWTVSSNQAWLSLSPGTGSSVGETDNVIVSVNITSLRAGIYRAEITITAPGATNSPQRIPVTLTITEVIPLSLTVFSPKLGEVWEVDEIRNIRWQTKGEGIAWIDIYYSTDGGKSMRHFAWRESNDGVYSWRVPDTPSTTALVRVIAYNAKGEYLISGDSGLFTIKEKEKEKTPLSLIVASPNGGEYWFIGKVYNITWSSTGEINVVDIRYSVDGGKSWILIASNEPNDGIYTWKIPDTPSGTALVSIQASTPEYLITDQSNNYFTILYEKRKRDNNIWLKNKNLGRKN